MRFTILAASALLASQASAQGLISVFQVGAQVLESRYTLVGDTLTHDITFWNATPATTTRGSGANAEGGVAITTHRIAGRQRAVMTRVGRP